MIRVLTIRFTRARRPLQRTSLIQTLQATPVQSIPNPSKTLFGPSISFLSNSKTTFFMLPKMAKPSTRLSEASAIQCFGWDFKRLSFSSRCKVMVIWDLKSTPVRGKPFIAVRKSPVGQDLSWRLIAPCQDKSWPTQLCTADRRLHPIRPGNSVSRFPS